MKNRKTRDKIRERRALTHFDLGEIYLAMKQYSLAVESYTKALELSPDLFYASLGIALADVGVHGLMTAAERYIEREDHKLDLSYALAYIGTRYLEHEDYDRALEAMKAAVANGMKDWHLYCNMGDCLQKMGRPDDAITEFQKSVELNEDNADSLLRLAELFESLDRPAEAIAAYKMVLGKFQGTSVYNRLALLYASADEFRRAIKMARIAIMLDPNDTFQYLVLGYSYLKLNRYEEAVESLKQFAWLMPYRPEPYNLLAEVYEETGDYDMSQYYRKKADEMNRKLAGSSGAGGNYDNSDGQ